MSIVPTTSINWIGVRIAGYNETILPNYWIHFNIMQQPMPEDIRVPNYALTDVAYSIIAHVLKRGENDPFLLRFARKLINTSAGDDLLVTMLKMEYMALLKTASEICTAAYQAYNELESEQGNGQQG
jgi:hypothetical protein